MYIVYIYIYTIYRTSVVSVELKGFYYGLGAVRKFFAI